MLQRLVGAAETDARSLSLRTPCTLEVRWKTQASSEYDLLGLDTIVDTNETTKDFVVFLRHRSGPASPLLLSTPDWATMTMVRSEINQLRADCGDWQDQRRT